MRPLKDVAKSHVRLPSVPGLCGGREPGAALFPFASKFARVSGDMAAQPRHLCDGSRRPRRRGPCARSARGPTLCGAANGATITAVECAASTAAASGALLRGSRRLFGDGWQTLCDARHSQCGGDVPMANRVASTGLGRCPEKKLGPREAVIW
jgi:hypothetical protein